MYVGILIIITYLRRVQEVICGGNGYFVEDECLVVAGIQSLVLRLRLQTIPHEVNCIHTYIHIYIHTYIHIYSVYKKGKIRYKYALTYP